MDGTPLFERRPTEPNAKEHKRLPGDGEALVIYDDVQMELAKRDIAEQYPGKTFSDAEYEKLVVQWINDDKKGKAFHNQIKSDTAPHNAEFWTRHLKDPETVYEWARTILKSEGTAAKSDGEGNMTIH